MPPPLYEIVTIRTLVGGGGNSRMPPPLYEIVTISKLITHMSLLWL